MKISFSPVRADWVVPALSVSGSVLTIDGLSVDLSDYDAETAQHPLIVGQPYQEGKEWNVSVILPHGADAPESVRFPETVIVKSGSVPLPSDQ